MTRETKPGRSAKARSAKAGAARPSRAAAAPAARARSGEARGKQTGDNQTRGTAQRATRTRDDKPGPARRGAGGSEKAAHALSSLIRATPRKPAAKVPARKAGTGAARSAARPGGWKTCSRGHNYRGVGPCPICWPGGAGRIRRIRRA